jgi:hypothetical protein
MILLDIVIAYSILFMICCVYFALLVGLVKYTIVKLSDDTNRCIVELLKATQKKVNNQYKLKKLTN